MTFFNKIRLNKTIGDIDEIDLQGRTLFKTLFIPKMSVAVIYLFINYLFANNLNYD